MGILKKGDKTIDVVYKTGEKKTYGKYVVRVIDYDGTILKEQNLNSGATFTMPGQPSHSNLIFQEWSSPVDIINNTFTVEDQDIIIGPVYTTASGLSEFDIVLTKVTGLDVTLNMDGTKNWGDGTSDTLTTHTYAQEGNYTITCDGTTITTSNSGGLFGQSISVKNYYCKNVRLANVTSIGDYAFRACYSLTNITIPNNVTSIGSNAFQNCFSLTNITISNNVTSIGSSAFIECYSLTNITIPNNVTSIGDYAFQNCFSLTEYDFSEFDTPPTLSNTNTFSNINGICKILVKDQAALTAFQTATNWSTYADYMYIKE